MKTRLAVHGRYNRTKAESFLGLNQSKGLLLSWTECKFLFEYPLGLVGGPLLGLTEYLLLSKPLAYNSIIENKLH